MAYRFPDEIFDRPLTRSASARVPAPLTSIEARVVELALADGRVTLLASRWRRMLAVLLGLRLPGPLASPRLEALRRFVVLSRDAGAAAADEVAKLLSLGFSRDQICAVEHRVAAR